MLKTLTVLFTAAVAAALIGCGDEPTVEEDKSRTEFREQAEQKLAALEKRIGEVREKLDPYVDEDVTEPVRANLELAEDMIASVRDEALDRLMQADGEAAEKVKVAINDQLTDIDERIDAANQALEEADAEGDTFVGVSRKRIRQLRERAERVEEPAGEEAESFLDKAELELSKYANATEQGAKAIRDNVDSLLENAETALDQATDE